MREGGVLQAEGPAQAKAQRSEIRGAGRGEVAGSMAGWEERGLCSKCDGRP